MRCKAKLSKIILPLAIIALAVIGMKLLIASRSEPKKEVHETPGALVETLTAVKADRQVQVVATGTVQPHREITLTPQVGGKLVEVSPRLVVGGLFQAQEVMLRIEDTDYRLAVDRARAALAKAEYELANEQSLAEVARREWNRMGEEQIEPSPLVLREPQLKNAQATLLSARAALAQAELELARTVLRAPFAALVRTEAVDFGQVVRAGMEVATLMGTREAEVLLPLPVAELDWLRIPRPGRSEAGAPAEIRLTAGNRHYQWNGRLERVLGEVDPRGRMARVVVQVEDPYGLNDPAGTKPALAVGSFVEVTLHGELLPDVVVLPAAALRDNQTVWLVDDGRLRIQAVEVLRRTRNEVVIGAGVADGEQVVLTYLPGAAAGMKLRLVADTATRESDL
ncbi:MAG: efflux RND transporter periplasmic adaptor subunit [Desulfuromonadaceae bacterium]